MIDAVREVLVAVLVVLAPAIALGVWAGNKALDAADDGNVRGVVIWCLPLLVAVIWVMSWLVYASNQEDTKGPCLREQTSVTWDPSTKTMREFTYCVERGSWK